MLGLTGATQVTYGGPCQRLRYSLVGCRRLRLVSFAKGGFSAGSFSAIRRWWGCGTLREVAVYRCILSEVPRRARKACVIATCHFGRERGERHLAEAHRGRSVAVCFVALLCRCGGALWEATGWEYGGYGTVVPQRQVARRWPNQYVLRAEQYGVYRV